VSMLVNCMDLFEERSYDDVLLGRRIARGSLGLPAEHLHGC
jgi:hypothetical protein